MAVIDRFLHRMRLVEEGLDEMTWLASLPQEDLEVREEEISAWSVGQQLQHLARADHGIGIGLLGLLEDPSKGEPIGPRLLGRLILLVGRIPRGRGRAPKSTSPEPEPAVETLRREVEQARTALLRCGERAEDLLALDRTIPHPYFGGLGTLRWIRFVEIHQEHHLRIVREIRGARAIDT